MSRTTAVRLGALLAIVVAAAVTQLVVGLPSQDDLRRTLDGLGPWGVPVFIAVYVGVCLLPAGPTALVTLVGGALLGFGVGLAAVLVGANLGALAAFSVSRFLGRDAIVKVSNQRVRSLDEKVRVHGFTTVVVARLVPLVPFSTANYVFGLTSVRRRDFAVATVVGIVPGTTVYVAVGAFGTQPGSLPFLLAIAALVLLSLIGFVRQHLIRGRSAEPTNDGCGPGRGSPG